MSFKSPGATWNDVAGRIWLAGLVFDTCGLTFTSHTPILSLSLSRQATVNILPGRCAADNLAAQLIDAVETYWWKWPHDSTRIHATLRLLTRPDGWTGDSMPVWLMLCSWWWRMDEPVCASVIVAASHSLSVRSSRLVKEGLSVRKTRIISIPILSI